MHRFSVIVFGALIGTAFYMWCVYMLKNENCRNFVRQHTFLHPNSICYIRTVLAWIGYGMYFFVGWQSWGIIVFTFAAILDGVDGLVARKCDLITAKGESLDPLCDKLTYLPPLIGFTYENILTTWVVWLFVAIEFFGQFFARRLLEQFNLSVSANNFGKIKTIICFVLVILCGLLDEYPHWINMCDEILILCIGLGCASIIFKFVKRTLYADIFSALNLISGLCGIILAIYGHITLAVLAVITGQLFDLLDGYAARKIAGTRLSPYLDDIADFICFGLCPLLIIQIHCGNSGILPAFIYLLCAMYHMTAQKNVFVQNGTFNGLPSAAGALITLGACLALNTFGTIIVTLIVSILLVSRIRFAHLSIVLRKKTPKPVFFVLSAAILVILAYILKSRNAHVFGYTILSCAILYLMIGLYMAHERTRVQKFIS